jgi:hypothetical protein
VTPVACRVSRNDTAFASQRSGYLFGPLRNVDTSEGVRRRLRAIAAAGPAHRVGLSPNRYSRTWSFLSSCDNVAVSSIKEVDAASAPDVLLDFVGSHPDAPLHIGVGHRWLILAFDHGLGAGRLMVELAAAITSDDPGFAEPLPKADCRNPGLTSAAHALRTSPRAMLASVADLPRRGNGQQAIRSAEPINTGTALVHVRSADTFLPALREERQRWGTSASTLGILASKVLCAFERSGLRPSGVANFLIDLNRYLPATTGTLANFVGMASIPVAAPYDPVEITESLQTYTQGYRALVRYGRSYLSQTVRRPQPLVRLRTPRDTVSLMISDHRMPEISTKIRWDRGDRIFLTTASFQYDNQVTLVLAPVDDELHVSATFRPDVHAPEAMRIALDSIVDLR